MPIVANRYKVDMDERTAQAFDHWLNQQRATAYNWPPGDTLLRASDDMLMYLALAFRDGWGEGKVD